MLPFQKILRAAIFIGGFAVLAVISWRVHWEHRGRGQAQSQSPSPLAQYGRLDDFTLQRQDGRDFGLENLKGHPWIASFIFTRCTGPCPIISTRLSKIHREFKDRPLLHFVSFSVDPDYDTPEILTRYGERYQADDRWHFLTGETQVIYDLMLEKFKVAMGHDKQGGEEKHQGMTHSLSFVLVDGGGRIRGYYSGVDDEAMGRLRRNAQEILGETL